MPLFNITVLYFLKQQDEDARQEKMLSGLDLKVVRFGNNKLMRDAEWPAVVGKIKEIANMSKFVVS